MFHSRDRAAWMELLPILRIFMGRATPSIPASNSASMKYSHVEFDPFFMMTLKRVFVLSLGLIFLSGWQSIPATNGRPAVRSTPTADQIVLAEDFEDYRVGGLPTKWKFIDGRRKLIPISKELMSAEEYFVVKEEDGNKYLRAVTMDRAHRMLLTQEELGDWDMSQHPYLRWEWRAQELPEGAREDKEGLNDSGAAVYVTFSQDWLGRPRSIKYSYSSTLPVGTVVDFGRLKVVVVASGKNGIRSWKTIERNVAEDYRKYFGDEPPRSPVSIMLWSDSNSVHGKAVADFDDFAYSSRAGIALR